MIILTTTDTPKPLKNTTIQIITFKKVFQSLTDAGSKLTSQLTKAGSTRKEISKNAIMPEIKCDTFIICLFLQRYEIFC